MRFIMNSISRHVQIKRSVDKYMYVCNMHEVIGEVVLAIKLSLPSRHTMIGKIEWVKSIVFDRVSPYLG